MKRICRAVMFSEYGEAEVLRVAEYEVPEPGPGQVRIAVRAAGVNPIDWKIRSGLMAAVMPVRFPAVPGVDVAGVVESVGPDVPDVALGDEVFGKAVSGSYAELALANRDAIAEKPAAVSWEVAAALPVAGTTAYHALAGSSRQPGGACPRQARPVADLTTAAGAKSGRSLPQGWRLPSDQCGA